MDGWISVKVGGVGRKEISCFLVHQLTIVLAGLYVFWQSTAHGRGLLSPQVCLVRTETSLAGVFAWFTHPFPHTESPSRSLGFHHSLSRHGTLALPRDARHIVAPQTLPAAPAAGAGAEPHEKGKTPPTPNLHPPEISHHRLQSN